jgi:hypothetical protein
MGPVPGATSEQIHDAGYFDSRVPLGQGLNYSHGRRIRRLTM